MALVFDPSQTQFPQIQIPAGQGPNMGPGFLGNIAQAWQDPNVRQAVLSTGLNLMRSPGYGQNGWDVAANSLQTGMGTLQSLRERDRQRALEAEDRKIKEEQRGIENKRGDRQVSVQEKNAQTSATNVEGDAKNKDAQLKHAEKQLEEAIRHNKSSEEIAKLRALADNIRATTYAGGGGRTPAEIEKLNRLKAFYKKQNPELSDEEADKQAMDYLSTSKGKSPRQLVIDAYTKKAQSWLEQQFDPTAQPTPEMRETWKKQAMEEVKFAEEAGADVTATRGSISRGSPATGTPPAASPATRSGTPSTAPAAASTAGASTAPDPFIQRQIEIWKTGGGTPDQIKLLIQKQGGDPAAYGY